MSRLLRAFVHRGSVEASGFVIARAVLSDREALRRVLELAPHGIEVFQTKGAWIVTLGTPMRVDCAVAPGAPLVRFGSILSAAPLDEDEERTLDAKIGSEPRVLLVAGGVAEVHALGALPREDLAAHIDVSDFAFARDVVSLGLVATRPTVALDAVVPDVRKASGVAAMAPESSDLLASLRQRRAEKSAKREATSGRSRLFSGRSATAGAVAFLLTFFANLFRAPAPEGQGTQGKKAEKGGKRAPIVTTAHPAGPSFFARIRAALEQAFAKLLLASRLAPYLGRRHAAYLARVVEMLEEGRFEEALRHALPLNSDLEQALGPPALSPPSPRKDLAISPAHGHATSSVPLSSDGMEFLRQKYRRAFERLQAQGEIDKAAFVLAELLLAHEEAVNFLERHKRFRLAAEIAEARKLRPALVVRQWVLAGDHERAARIAKTHGAFYDAVSLLAVQYPKQAERLRLMWADELASSGAYFSAADVVWNVPGAREIALLWIGRAIEVGGVLGARALARKALCAPAGTEDVAARCDALFSAGREETGELAAAFAGEVVRFGAAAPVKGPLRRAIRAMLRETGSSRFIADRKFVERALRAAGDASLTADAPLNALSKHLPPPAHAVDPALPPPTIRRVASDRGAVPIFDAAVLPDGRILLATGESGARLLSRDGRTVARFAEPAHRLVLSDHGDRALVLAPRGDVVRVARLDLVSKRIEPWCDAKMDAFAPDFDGSLWLVATGSSAYAIDATSAGWNALWSVEDRGRKVRAIRRSERWLSVHFSRGVGGEVWVFEAGSKTLRHRHVWQEADDVRGLGVIAPSGTYAGWRSPLGGTSSLLGVCEGNLWNTIDAFGAPFDGRLELSDHGLIALYPMSDGVTLAVSSVSRGSRPRAIHLEGVSVEDVHVRVQGDVLTVCDAAGRVLLISLKSVAVLREHRVT